MSIPPAQIVMLKKASATGLPLIFLPLHRSHVDYIAVTFTLCNNSIRSPLVAAGENLRIPIFGWILRGLGAFFIKRWMDPESGKRDKLYRASLHTYMTQCIEAGHYFEFFIEGGRTRTGKPCMPKGGLLSVFVDAYLSGTLQDALLVPVSVNYERLVEGSFVREQTGESKQPESFRSAISGIWAALTRHYGTVRVDFNQPFSLNELVRSFQNKMRNTMGSLHVSPSTTSLYGTDVVVEEQRQLVDCIARHILYDCSRSTAVMSTNALAFLLLNVYRDGVKLVDLALALDKLREELYSSGKDTGFTGESIDVIEHAVKMLGPGLVLKERSSDCVVIKPVTVLPNVIELAYYSNTLLPHFVLEGIVGSTIHYLSRQDPSQRVSCDKLLDTCADLCEILQFEFLFTETCQNLNDALFETVDKMATSEILISVQGTKMSSKRNVGCPRNLDIIDDDDNFYRPPCTIYKNLKDHPKLVLYSRLLMPIIDTYTITAQALYTLVGTQKPERDFVNYVLTQIKRFFEKGVISCGESVSTDSVRNCLKLFEKWSVLEVLNQSNIKICYLNSNYDSELNLEPVVDRIQCFQFSSNNE
ncbi:hypothetical protein AAG570_009779 [Ranatra chinensis]|uniref:Phospholipid/glycerol acyltransferase domain-containing protein n=1 Tax=Ranatra chinensis TaxID=642074 RepID=A0ABD0YQ15_9HEMI